MLSVLNYLRFFLLAFLLNTLIACGSSEEQIDTQIDEAKRLYQDGSFKKAFSEFDKIAVDDKDNKQTAYKIAEALTQLGDLSHAAEQYRKIIKNEPNQSQAKIKLGHLYLLAGQIAEANKQADEVLNQEPDNSEAMVLQASILAAQNNTDAAFVKADAVLQKKPEDVMATLLLASLHAKTGQIDKAITLLQKNIAKHPEHIASRLLLVNLYSQLKQTDNVEDGLNEIIRIEPKVITHRKRLAEFLINSQQLDKAEVVLRDAMKALPDNTQAKLLLIDFLARLRTPELAIAELLPLSEAASANQELRLKLAELQLFLKQRDKAETTLKVIIAADQQDRPAVTATLQLARLYLATQRVDLAKSTVNALLEKFPEEEGGLALRGEIALAENRITDAIADFRAVLAQKPADIAVLKLLSAAHLVNKDNVLAKENLEKIVALSPTDETARLDLVSLLFQAGDTTKATQQLNELFKLNPNSKNGLQALFKLQAGQQQWDQALHVAKQVEKFYPEEALGYYLAGLAYQGAGKLEQSSLELEQAMKKQPQMIEPLTQLVKNYLAAKQPDKARDKLLDAVKGQANNYFAYNLLGEVYSRGNKTNEALNAYQQALNIKPTWSVPYRNIAILHILQKHEREAMEILKKGIANAPEPTELVADLAALYHQQGDHQKVIDLYEEQHNKFPGSLTVLNNLVSYLIDYGNGIESLNHAAELAKPLQQTTDVYYQDTLGWLAYKQGNFEKAQQWLTKVIETNPASAISQYHLGMVYLKQGDKLQAQNHLQKAIDSKEDFANATEAKQLLESLKKPS